MNNQDTVFGGVMEIFNCDDTSCDFKLQSWYNLHICDVEGRIETTGDNAEYKGKKYQYDRETDTEYFIPVGILFQIKSKDKQNHESMWNNFIQYTDSAADATSYIQRPDSCYPQCGSIIGINAATSKFDAAKQYLEQLIQINQ